MDEQPRWDWDNTYDNRIKQLEKQRHEDYTAWNNELMRGGKRFLFCKKVQGLTINLEMLCNEYLHYVLQKSPPTTQGYLDTLHARYWYSETLLRIFQLSKSAINSLDYKIKFTDSKWYKEIESIFTSSFQKEFKEWIDKDTSTSSRFVLNMRKDLLDDEVKCYM